MLILHCQQVPVYQVGPEDLHLFMWNFVSFLMLPSSCGTCMSRGITGHNHLEGYDKPSMTSRKRTLNLMRILSSANKMSTMLAK